MESKGGDPTESKPAWGVSWAAIRIGKGSRADARSHPLDKASYRRYGALMSKSTDIFGPRTPAGEWWFTDSRGRKIGYMWPEDALAVLDSLYGKRKGIAGFAAYAGLHHSTVEKYCNGKYAIPQHIAVLILNMQATCISRRKKIPARPYEKLPALDAPWLEKHQDDGAFKVDARPFK